MEPLYVKAKCVLGVPMEHSEHLHINLPSTTEHLLSKETSHKCKLELAVSWTSFRFDSQITKQLKTFPQITYGDDTIVHGGAGGASSLNPAVNLTGQEITKIVVSYAMDV